MLPRNDLHKETAANVFRWIQWRRLLAVHALRSVLCRDDTNWNRWYLQLYALLEHVWYIPVLLYWLHVQPM